jgi:hypothetical protein
MLRAFIIPILLIAGLACNKGHICDCPMPYQIYYLKASVVTSSDLSCNRPVLEFSEDSSRIRLITGAEGLTYVGQSLNSGLNVTGQKIYVSVSKMPASEEFACNTMGLNYPHLKVIDAKVRP